MTGPASEMRSEVRESENHFQLPSIFDRFCSHFGLTLGLKTER
jgi:hypothetical protein